MGRFVISAIKWVIESYPDLQRLLSKLKILRPSSKKTNNSSLKNHLPKLINKKVQQIALEHHSLLE